ncbi:MAG: DUF2757 domain-containing protein [Thermocaproicibacter melissae]|jgi:hypothetical protein|uniref:DUF6171 family protein n=1 Tax=Thermocaproicibacter melissae TaxID=2966552 RepID=UPI0024B0D2DA|nr:DUF6171 family protein [Thermocaproicibacter melissae]WBY63943.1 DUF6171 family protein [Thermocaproicibacter melissae]
MERIPCRKCLDKDMTEEEYRSLIGRYIDAIAEDRRTPEEEYSRRLKICSTCKRLTGGMCLLCGCFAEVRAAVKDRHCAEVPAKW